jgi:N-acetyl-gamma-glutamyl-phosphate reductase
MIRAAVVGATGYAGAELVRILAGHPDVELAVITSRQHAGVALSEVFPAFRGLVDTVCEAYTPERVAGGADVAFLALPHRLPMAIAPPLLDRGIKVIDLSADFRFRDRARYEAHYQPHTAPEWLERSVYGLSEVFAASIREAQLVGNPGCYPTSVLLPLVPLLKANLLDTRSLIADAKSGVSGAGRSPSLTSLFSEVTESFKPYKVASHRHNPEMDEILGHAAGVPVHITFVPHLVPMSRGMLSTIYALPREGTTPESLRRCLEEFYARSAFVRLLPDARLPDTRSVRGTNFCDIAVRMDDGARRVILMSAIDNLVKGAAGQAVQNMNLMWGLDERRGLMAVPFPL